jgi:hypothetical protein
MDQVTIPPTLDAARSALGGIDRLLTAKEWERAATVAAFVRLPGSGAKVSTDFCSPGEFAEHGIRGLSSHVTVRSYVERWLKTVGSHPTPGEVVTLPDAPWPPEGRSAGSRTTVNNVGDSIREDVNIAAAAAVAVADVLPDLPDDTRNRLGRAVDDDRRLRFAAIVGERPDPSLDESWLTWLTRANHLFTVGARLAERSEQDGTALGGHSGLALALYERLTERHIDAEIRQLFDSEEIGR